jgi:selenide, water dikinase
VQVLQGLPKVVDANALVGTETGDDAAVYLLDAQTAVVQTVDFFSPIVDDPFDFGQIAAANALSDVYAMGGRPIFALNIAGFPVQLLPLAVLQEILRGGAEKAAEAGIPILGGHTVEDAEPKYGMVVTGLVHPDRIARNVGARPGDQLVLTKPLGTGIVANAAKSGACPADALASAVASMRALNRGAAEAMQEVGADACTDVTGFGLLGHLRPMLRGSGAAARLWASRLPVLPMARELAAEDYLPGGSRRNRAFGAESVLARGASGVDLALANDAQTSGGLLIAVRPERLEALLAGLARRKTPAAAHVGEVIEGPPGQIEISG